MTGQGQAVGADGDGEVDACWGIWLGGSRTDAFGVHLFSQGVWVAEDGVVGWQVTVGGPRVVV